jgi:acetyl esterase/lipase
MLGIKNHLDSINIIKLLSISSIILNLFCLISGALYIIDPFESMLWQIFGIILAITIFHNLGLSFLNSLKICRPNKHGHLLNILTYCFLIFTMMGVMGILGGNLLISTTISSNSAGFLAGEALTYFFYFGMLLFGFSKSVLILKYIRIDREKPCESPPFRIMKLGYKLKRLIGIFSQVLFILGIIFAVTTVFGSFEVVTTFIAIISGQFGVFFSFIFFANTLLLIKLKRNTWNKKKVRRRAISGTVISLILLLPFIIAGVTAFRAEINFSQTVGSNWQNKIPIEIDRQFLQSPFTSTSYFLGESPKECLIQQDVLYYQNNSLSLYFDAYLPINRDHTPGQNSTLIRIHGGAWTSGDKGAFNNVQMNKYFAAQGYVVFDIQYGLKGIPLSSSDTQIGDYNIDDMLYHIGKFTAYLVNHSKEYGANINSVFISGGSSGGHLTCATALAITSGNYSEIFNQEIKIKGYIPFYPANGAMSFFGIDGRPEFKNPQMLINKNSPPCLIFQGTHDILNYFGISLGFKDVYMKNSNINCTILWMPFGGHGSDFYFSGYYNQIFLYYMERFMFIYK